MCDSETVRILEAMPQCVECGHKPSYMGTEAMIVIPALVNGYLQTAIFCSRCANRHKVPYEEKYIDFANLWLNQRIDITKFVKSKG
jgi:hypothetical protein